MKATLLDPRSREWSSLLDGIAHDFYHLPAYVDLSARLDGGVPHALYVESVDGALLLPLVRRSIPAAPDRWDALSPYGYPGPLVTTSGDPESFAAQALVEGRDLLRREGCVSLFVRCHPLLGVAPREPGVRVQHGETVFIDLDKSSDVLWSETMSGHRNEINRSIKANHRASFDDDFRHVDRFVAIYHDTMTRVGASAGYFFDRAYVMGLREALGPRLKLGVIEIDGAIAGAALFVVTGDIVQYHLSGTAPEYARARPTKLLLHFVRGWAKEHGARRFHLGGGVGGTADSLFKFKAGFSPCRSAFYTLRVVTDADEYRRLSRAKHPDVDPDELDGFFPLYRRP